MIMIFFSISGIFNTNPNANPNPRETHLKKKLKNQN